MNYCLWPWSHLYFHTDKGAYPCCKLAGIDKFKLGKTSDSVSSLWNSDRLKQLRKDFINGTPPEECIKCCMGTPHPLNIHIPENLIPKKEEYYKETGPDGSFRENFIIYNMAASNLCNFKCAYCYIGYSSRFYEDNHMLSVFKSAEKPITERDRFAFDNKEQMLKSFEEQIPHLEKIYFSAGESRMQEIYYDMLDILVAKDKLDIDIEFITNLSGYEFRKRNIFELLNKFKNMTLVASLDTNGKRAEYIRYGTDWSLIERNRKILLNYKNIKFLLQPVVTNLSMLSLPDFHYDWFQKGFVGKSNVRYIVLQSPIELCINNIPLDLKDKIEKKYAEYASRLDENDTLANKMTPSEKVKQMVEFMKTPSTITSTQLQLFMAKLNLTRGMKHKDIFTELNLTLPLI